MAEHLWTRTNKFAPSFANMRPVTFWRRGLIRSVLKRDTSRLVSRKALSRTRNTALPRTLQRPSASLKRPVGQHACCSCIEAHSDSQTECRWACLVLERLSLTLITNFSISTVPIRFQMLFTSVPWRFTFHNLPWSCGRSQLTLYRCPLTNGCCHLNRRTTVIRSKI